MDRAVNFKTLRKLAITLILFVSLGAISHSFAAPGNLAGGYILVDIDTPTQVKSK